MTIPISGAVATPEHLSQAAARAEELGFRSLWVGDHVVIPTQSESHYPYSPDGRMAWDPAVPWLEPVMALQWAAAATTSVRLGTSVLILPMRPVLLAAKQLATLDVLSGGRLVVGLGSGWFKEEFEVLGQSFENRSARLVEEIAVLRACWEGGIVEFHGRHHDFPPFGFAPRPVKGANLPILLGGHSPVALRRVAEAGDGWQPTNVPPDRFAELLPRLKEYVEGSGRSMSEIRLVARPGTGKPFDLEMSQRFSELGVTEIITEVNWRALSFEAALEAMEKIAAELRIQGGGRPAEEGEAEALNHRTLPCS